MLQGAPTSYIFPVFDEHKVYLREDIVVQHYSHIALNNVLNYFLKIIQMVSFRASCTVLTLGISNVSPKSKLKFHHIRFHNKLSNIISNKNSKFIIKIAE